MSQQTRHRRLCTTHVLNMLGMMSCMFIMVSPRPGSFADQPF